MKIIAIDPGCSDSAFIRYEDGKIHQFGKVANNDLREMLPRAVWPNDLAVDHVVIEMIASYGMPVGREVFETCVWIGRFIEVWGGDYSLVYRKDVKLHLCGSVRAKDSNIRQALIDRFGAPGTKKTPGPTFGVAADVWAALAVATTFTDRLANDHLKQRFRSEGVDIGRRLK